MSSQEHPPDVGTTAELVSLGKGAAPIVRRGRGAARIRNQQHERHTMPVIRIEVPEGTDLKSKKTIREQVEQAVLTTLAPKETKYDYVGIREVFGEIGDGLPLIEVNLRPGREPQRKKALVDAIASVLKSELQIQPEDIYVLFRETPAPGHYTGGTPLPEWVPADRQRSGLFRVIPPDFSFGPDRANHR